MEAAIPGKNALCALHMKSFFQKIIFFQLVSGIVQERVCSRKNQSLNSLVPQICTLLSLHRKLVA